MTDSRLINVLRALLPQFFPREPFLGPRRYRVVRMRPSASSSAMVRAELQIVKAVTGLPDLLITSVWPGAAGFTSELTPGAHVLVEFIDGDPEQPMISHYSTPDDAAWKPAVTRLDATAITLGSGSPPKAVRVGDACGRLCYDNPPLKVYYSPSATASYALIPSAAGMGPPIPSDTGITVVVATGSSKVGIE